MEDLNYTWSYCTDSQSVNEDNYNSPNNLYEEMEEQNPKVIYVHTKGDDGGLLSKKKLCYFLLGFLLGIALGCVMVGVAYFIISGEFSSSECLNSPLDVGNVSAVKVNDVKLEPPPHRYIWYINPAAKEQTYNGQDGDVIIVTKMANPNPYEGLITLRLRQPGLHYKAIHVHDGAKFLYRADWIKDETVNNTNNVPYEDFSRYSIVLSKGMNSVHSDIYWIRNANQMDPAYIWDFNWIKD